MEMPNHLISRNRSQCRRSDCRCRCHPLRVPCKTGLTEELAGFEHRDDGFFPIVRQHRHPHRAVLHVHDCCGRVTLSENDVASLVPHALCEHTGPVKRAVRRSVRRLLQADERGAVSRAAV